jgi:hypothetical protein
MLTSADAHARHLIVPDFAIRGDIGDQVTDWVGGDDGSGHRQATCHRGSERVTGIEPAPPAWKAGALPLSYTRVPRSLCFAARTHGIPSAATRPHPAQWWRAAV